MISLQRFRNKTEKIRRGGFIPAQQWFQTDSPWRKFSGCGVGELCQGQRKVQFERGSRAIYLRKLKYWGKVSSSKVTNQLSSGKEVQICSFSPLDGINDCFNWPGFRIMCGVDIANAALLLTVINTKAKGMRTRHSTLSNSLFNVVFHLNMRTTQEYVLK